MLRRPSTLLAPLALVAPLAAFACGRTHDLGTTTSTGGTSSSSSTTTTTTSSSTGTGGTGGAGGLGGAGPSGPTELTVVNGINDYPAVRLCFLPGDTPWPASASGLVFGAGLEVDLASVIPTGTDVTPWVIAGDLGSTAGMTCTQIHAAAGADGGPTLLTTPLAVLPESVFASNESLLLVPLGCLGGAGHDDPNEALACGMGYTSQTPNASVALVAMSRRTNATQVSLLVVQASSATPTIDVKVLPNTMNAMPLMIAPGLTLGAIEPPVPFAQLDLAGFGSLDVTAIQTYVSGEGTPSTASTLGPLLAASAVGTAGFVNGASLVLVAVGAAPGFPAGSFWHKLTFAVVKADPG